MDDPVTHLAWICPSAASLAALARRGPAARPEVPADAAAALGADPTLFQIVKLVITLVAERGADAPPAGGVTAAAAAEPLGLADDLDALRAEAAELLRRPPPREWLRPDAQPLLVD